MTMGRRDTRRLGRREFLTHTSRSGAGLALAAAGLPGLLAACGRDGNQTGAPPTAPPGTAPARAEALVGDVVDFALTSPDWTGPFGFVTLRLHRGFVNGEPVHFVRTDTSDQAYADRHRLVWAPKLRPLARTAGVGAAYEVPDEPDQPVVLTTHPGMDGYTPAYRVHRVTWRGTPRELTSVAEIRAADADGQLRAQATDVVVNAAVVAWPSGQLPVDEERTAYLGGGQLLEAPDTAARTVTFKLHECYPDTRYIVVDTALEPMAEGMRVAHSPGLATATAAEATGRTNVFMNGISGPGPMGFQPSVFDSRAGEPDWSPYWDHLTYAWRDGAEPRLLTDERAIHTARDAGQLREFPGTPDTGGMTFTVNCPVPVIAPNSFAA